MTSLRRVRALRMRRHTLRRLPPVPSILLLSSILVVGGCVSLPALPQDPYTLAGPNEYRIGAGDLLAVKFFYTPELNEEVGVRPDGGISLQLVGDVIAAGRTPDEISAELKERYARFLTQPDVTVIVKVFGSQRAYVGGEVRAPSMVAVDGRMDLAGAVFVAGGLKETASMGSVVLLRRGPNGREAYKVDLADGLEGKIDLPVIRAYDVVFVPKSPIAHVNDFVELYINRILPRNGSFFATYQINQPGFSDTVIPNTVQ